MYNIFLNIYIFNICGLGRIRRICEYFDPNPTQPIVKKNSPSNPIHQPLKTDQTQQIELD